MSTKSKTVLGISAFYHDSAAAIVKDGEVIAAAQEERFTRKKFDPRFPINAINYCLEEAFIEPDELDAIVYYDNSILTFDRVIQTIVSSTPHSLDQWKKAAKSILGIKLHVKDLIKEKLKVDVPIFFTKHHAAHAASAFYPSPFDEAAFLTIDGAGEWESTTLGKANKNGIHTIKSIEFPHSLGLLYSAFTYFTGFKVNSGEYKMMGLAPYGKPEYVNIIKNELINIFEDGSYQLNMDYFGYLNSNKMISHKFQELFHGPERHPDDRITKREVDIAASVQIIIEEVILKLAKTLAQITQMKNLVMAGGVALNCVANGKLLREGIFENIWIQPAAGDAGGALGAALLISHEHFRVKRIIKENKRDTMKGAYLGPQFSRQEIKAFLKKESIKYHEIKDQNERNRFIAEKLSNGKIVGYFNGRMEFGPRALGARSILGDPRNSNTQVNMNLKIKYRESFRPFAPTVLYNKCSNYFEIDTESPYMLLVANVKKNRQKEFEFPDITGDSIDLLEIVRQERSDIPAVTHVDYSARIQTVYPDDKPDYYALIREFERITGYGVIVNTSFNVRGEPIVCTPKDAYNCFQNTEMDYLVLENFILYKSEQPEKDKSQLEELLAEDTSTQEIMNKTKDNKENKILERFYKKYFLDIDVETKQKIISRMKLMNNLDAIASNFKEVNDSNNIISIDNMDIEKEIKKIWERDNLSGLLKILKNILALSNDLKEVEQSEEVSPYIYAMF